MSAPSATATPIPLSGLTRACRLAEGGMGRVDLAIKRVGSFRRLYAVKRLHPHLCTDPEFRQMFLDEARIAGMIRHPNVVGVLDVGEDDLGPFLVMDYVDGLPLGNLERLATKLDEPIPVQVAVRIALDVARGLHAAHELRIDGEEVGLVHRDLSPQNVMVGFDGQARLTDFGIAKALGQGTRTATGVVKGKTSYLAPEQIRFDEPDRRSDLFALGVVLYEMLAGERLYRRGAPSDDMRAILEEPAPDIGEVRGDVPPSLVRLLFELLAKERDERPVSARDVETRLEAVLAELLRTEPALSVADFVEAVASDARKEQTRIVEAAIADAERETRTPARNADATREEPRPGPVVLADPEAAPRPARGMGWIGPVLGAAALAVSAGAYLAVRAPAPSAITPVGTAPEVAPRETTSSGEAERPTTEAPVVGTATETERREATAETMPEAEARSDEATEPERERGSRGRGRGRDRGERGATETERGTGHTPLPSWVEFE